MNFRARLSLFALEARETPSSVPPIDPYVDPTTTTSPTPNNDPAQTSPPPASPTPSSPTAP